MAATLSVSTYRKQVWTEHAAILQAIVDGDPERARALSVAHTRAARAVLLQRMKQFLTDQSRAPLGGARRRKPERRRADRDASGARA